MEKSEEASNSELLDDQKKHKEDIISRLNSLLLIESNDFVRYKDQVHTILKRERLHGEKIQQEQNELREQIKLFDNSNVTRRDNEECLDLKKLLADFDYLKRCIEAESQSIKSIDADINKYNRRIPQMNLDLKKDDKSFTSLGKLNDKIEMNASEINKHSAKYCETSMENKSKLCLLMDKLQN
ncbi:hypothetical protein Ciccas_003605 [Cichlidogyrus casuarinus]|uniref:Uncharacterized protein n=1 Tax=Cichlidogyrus casuarinus TaxID=1844966 RepID=A0ABD2QEN8_9PLAT